MFSSTEFSLGNRNPETRTRVMADTLLLQINPILGWADENIEIIMTTTTTLGFPRRQYDGLEAQGCERQAICSGSHLHQYIFAEVSWVSFSSPRRSQVSFKQTELFSLGRSNPVPCFAFCCCIFLVSFNAEHSFHLSLTLMILTTWGAQKISFEVCLSIWC